MNPDDSSDTVLLDHQFALWREALALANAEKIARRRFAQRLSGLSRHQQNLFEASRKIKTAEKANAAAQTSSRAGAPATKVSDERWYTPLRFILRGPRHYVSGVFAAAMANSDAP